MKSQTPILAITVILTLALAALAAPARADQCILDDLIVDGSACIGFDCVCNETFGFDTLRLKENNLRITFIDTSTAASFPRGDWQLRANESANGGANEFAIDWLGTSATSGSGVVSTPFAIEGNAPNNALYVDDGGRIGVGTSVPSVEMHLVDGDTPALRLQQDGSSGFAPHTWDVAGNETNFFVRDVTSGSTLPFRIRPGAPSSAIFIDTDGDVGIGTSSPSQAMHLRRTNAASTFMMIENANAAAQITGLQLDNGGTSTGSPWDFRLAANGVFAISLQGSGANELVIDDNTGDVTIANDLTVTGTKNFAVPDPADASRWIYFSALEGPEAGTYYRGTGRTQAGEAVIELPQHFAKMTEAEGLTVQLTPLGGWSRLYVAEMKPDRLVIKDADGIDGIDFNYLVQGVRKGHAGFEVMREPPAGIR